MKRITFLVAVSLILSICTFANAQSQTFYVFHEMEGTLDEYGQDQGFEMGGQSCAYAINNEGEVAGSAAKYLWDSQVGQRNSYSSESAVAWRTPHFSQSYGNTTTTRAVGISENDAEHVLTQFIDSSWQQKNDSAWFGYTYGWHTNPDGSGQTVSAAITDPDGSFASPVAMNSNGQVVANGLHGDYGETSLLMTQVGHPLSPQWNYQQFAMEKALGLNDLGNVVGQSWVDMWNEDDNIYMSIHGYVGSTDLGHLWNPGVVQPGEQVLNAITTPNDINNQQVVVGESSVNENDGHAFIWNNGVMSDLGTFGGAESEAFAINELNMVVGQATTAAGDIHAFLYQDLVGMIDLNQLAPAATQAGLTLESAYDVNDFGAIVGKARDEFGEQKGFLLTPGGFLEGAMASGSFDPDGFDPANFSLDGLPEMAESLGTTIELDNFQLLGPSSTLSIVYDKTMLAGLGVSEQDIRLFWYDEVNQQWTLAGADSNNLPGGSLVLGEPTNQLGDFGVDTDANMVWANIDHASIYAVFAVPDPTTQCMTDMGDFNCDGHVGLLDLDILGTNWGATGVLGDQGDANGDGSVGLLDLNTLGLHWGETLTVPEPGSLALLGLSGLVLLRNRK